MLSALVAILGAKISALSERDRQTTAKKTFPQEQKKKINYSFKQFNTLRDVAVQMHTCSTTHTHIYEKIKRRKITFVNSSKTNRFLNEPRRKKSHTTNTTQVKCNTTWHRSERLSLAPQPPPTHSFLPSNSLPPKDPPTASSLILTNELTRLACHLFSSYNIF